VKFQSLCKFDWYLPDIKKQFPMLKGLTYLNSALSGVPPLQVTNAMKKSIEDWSQRGRIWDESMNDIISIKENYSRLVQADASEIAIVPSVSAGLVAIASSLSLIRGRRNAVVSSLNFSANKVIWQQMKASGMLSSVRLLEAQNGEIPIESYEKSIDDRTALVAIDFVSGYNGFVDRVGEISDIAHRHGAIFVVDAFHALGTMPFDVKKLGIDVMLAGFSKWMCGPAGAACLYVDRKVLPELEPSYLGWQGIKENIMERKLAGKGLFDAPFPSLPEPSVSAARFEWGSWSPVVLKGILEAIRFALKSSLSVRYSTIAKRKRELAEGLEDLDLEIITPEESINQGGGIIAFKIKNEKQFASRLAAEKVIIAANFGRVVASAHFFNSQEDADRFLKYAGIFSRS
jgi:selenocysteine lyase/cysteine desulfurase